MDHSNHLDYKSLEHTHFYSEIGNKDPKIQSSSQKPHSLLSLKKIVGRLFNWGLQSPRPEALRGFLSPSGLR